jgi:hypothetical protein
MFRLYTAIIRQHIYKELYPIAHQTNILLPYVSVIFFRTTMVLWNKA